MSSSPMSSTSPAPAAPVFSLTSWVPLGNTINIMNTAPKGAKFMPAAPPSNSGVVACTPEVSMEWDAWMLEKEAKNRGLLSKEVREVYVDFHRNPSATATAKGGHSQSQQCNLKIRVLKNFELQKGRYLYRRGENGKPARYAAGLDDAFWIIANSHSQLHHVGVRKTYERVSQMYYGITEEHVSWVVKHCSACCMNAPNATKPVITPIRVARCNDRIQIDLMDFRVKADGDYKWIIQIKDHFSRYVWLHPLVAKESRGVAAIMHNWVMYNGCPKILQFDNGTEFKGALLDLCGQFGIRVINGAPYKPTTQGSVESANRTFKRRLQALQTERGVRNWAYYLPEIALAINTTRPYGLRKGLTPYLVHFGRLPHWDSVAEAVYVPLNEDDDGDAIAAIDAADALESQLQDEISAANPPSSPDQPLPSPREPLSQTLTLEDTPATPQHISDDEERVDTSSPPERSEIEVQQAEFNEAAMERLIGRSISRNAVEFKENQVVSLKIPSKLRLAGEPTRIPVRIWKIGRTNRCTVISRYGWIKATQPWGELNQLPEQTAKNWGDNLLTGHPERDHGQALPVITLNKAVQLMNKRGSVMAAQKGGRKTARVANPAPSTSPPPVLPPYYQSSSDDNDNGEYSPLARKGKA